MGLNETGFGILMSSLAIGSLVGSFIVERVERALGRARILVVSVILTAAMSAVPGLTPNPWIVGAAFALSGVGVVMWNVVTVSLRQRIVPDRLLGRLNASYRLLAWGSQPLGALLGGAIGQVFGLRAVFLLSALVIGFLLLAFRIVTDRAIAAAETEEESGPQVGPAAGPAA
jgi:MFS family permease